MVGQRLDVLSPYRERIMYLLGVLGVAVLLPLAVSDFLRGLPSVALATLAILLVLGISAVVYYYIDVEATIRFLLTMALTIASSNVFLRIIGDLQGRLLEQSIIDPLTGAYNRRHMESCLGDAIERKQRYGGLASLLLLDIDHCKHINDRLGHSAGDGVLKAVAALITQRSRKVDQLFRIGGEEFLLLLPDTDERRAVIVGEHLRSSVAASNVLEGGQVSISVGVSELGTDESLDTWFRQADAALYRAKDAGRNRVASRAESL